MSRDFVLKLSLGLLVVGASSGFQVFLEGKPSSSVMLAHKLARAQESVGTDKKGQFSNSNAQLCTLDKGLAENLKNITPKGWKIDSEISQLTPDDLYLQINGRAELYKDYGVVMATFVNYVDHHNEMSFVEVAVYDMGNPTNAFGIFSVERHPGQSSLGLGRGSYRSDSGYYIWKGQHYVQILASDAKEELDAICLELARKVTNHLSDSGDPVWGLAALPKEYRVPDSEQYFRVNAMGMHFMTDTYLAQYRKNESTVTVFLSQRNDPSLARSTVSQYTDFAKQFGKGVERLNVEGLELFLCDMVDVYDVVFEKGRLVGGVSSVGDRNLAVQAAIDFWKRIQD